ncbi:MAG: BamA/TamA family outer membrane protein [Sulfurimonas sp.]|uniref:autotransporter assembly complex protein TamA n=1 Tax=Sulfurimonas sp. TaxID=2022749 RepID=UPI00261DA030|nr:BamA/TamA family outer membrane protein [Sulfurimonas sp.]MDD5372163.1 BamA/TamA family outer membrane protein [Sulfurimonas sp.]
MKKKLFLFFLFSTLLYAQSFLLFFGGNKALGTRELYDALEIHKPRFYEFYADKPSIELKDIELIKQTLETYYKSRGFYHADILHINDKNSITIIIEENDPIIVKSVTKTASLDIGKKIPFKEGDIFDANKFTQSKKDIKLLYANHHFCDISLNAKAWVDIEQNSAYLTYDVLQNERCHFGKIDVKPTENIDADILKSILYIKEGELFTTDKITKSYESIYGYEGVSKAIIDTSTDKNGSVDVTLSVFENEKPIRTQAGAGISSDEGAMLLLGAKHRNFLGDLKTLGIETRLTQIKQTIKTNFDMPLLNKNFTGFEVRYENERFTTFKEDRISADLFLKQNFLPHTFKESLVFDKSRTYDSDDETLFPKGSLFLISPKLEWGYDTRDKILEATSGYFVNSQIMGSLKSTLSDASYYKFKVNGGYIFPIDDYIFGLKATFGSLGVSDGYIPSSYRFFAGGMYSNRAYGYRKLGPTNSQNDPIGSDSILEATAEMRFDIYGSLRGVIFSDNTYLGNGSVPSYDNGYYSAGFGLRYKTPIGPIAIDFGFDIADPTKQYAIHFHIGELF